MVGVTDLYDAAARCGLLASGGHTIDWRWVRGHNGDPGNERADMLANKGVDSLQRGAR